MDGIVLLKEDHKTVEKLFKQFEKLGEDASAEEKRQLTDRITDEVTTHAYIDEEIFYPAVREADPSMAEGVLERIEEHHVIVWRCAELDNLDVFDERFDATMNVLIENVRRHVEEEEKQWFPDVRKVLGRNRLQELGERMERARAELEGHPLEVAGGADE